jgi:DNA-binding response OmpR family regulator
VSFVEDQLGGRGAGTSVLTAEQVRLLILDDDDELTGALDACAAERGWESHTLSEPATRRLLAMMGIDALLVNPDAINFDPWRWLARLRASLPNLAVVVVAGPSTVEERIHALGLGIDDWLQKPSHPEEVIERIAAAVRRRAVSAPAAGATATGRLRLVELAGAEGRVHVGGRSIELTERELEVLRALIARQGSVVERGSLYVEVWGSTMVRGDRSVDVYVRRLRDKLRQISPEWAYIHTQHRIGYRFQPERLKP